MDEFLKLLAASPYGLSPLPPDTALDAFREYQARNSSPQPNPWLAPNTPQGFQPQGTPNSLVAPISQYSNPIEPVQTHPAPSSNGWNPAQVPGAFMHTDPMGYQPNSYPQIDPTNSFYAAGFPRLAATAQPQFGAGSYGHGADTTTSADQGLVPDQTNSLTPIADRIPQCHTAAMTCVGNLPWPEFESCFRAEKACDMTINTLRNAPRALNVPTIIRFPDGTTVVLQGGPGGAAYIIPSPRKDMKPPDHTR